MKIKSVEIIGSYADARDFPPPAAPEFVFVGRSNVGKSSLINKLVNRKNVARTSNTPGKTRTANFYQVNEGVTFVDMPGYGFAEVPKSERAKWERLISAYLRDRESLRGVVVLLDIRHKAMKPDLEMIDRLSGAERPMCFVFTKVDKIKAREIDPRIAGYLEHVDVDPRTGVIAFSAETGMGRREVWAWVEDRLAAP